MVLIGVDGAEWKVIRGLWAEGGLPHLRRLAERGVAGRLRTDYGKSPVIWTTIATGRRPRVHGITDFVVPTAAGDVPVSSATRRAPALWTMLTRAHRRVAVVGWWASWPAEAVAGVVVSDRAHRDDLDDVVSPASWAPRLAALRRQAAARPTTFGGNEAAERRDELVAVAATELAGELAAGRYDLLLAYFRGVDIVSHAAWKYVEPEAFAVAPDDLAAHRHLVPEVYAATDRAIGAIVAAAGDANVLVVSDHGFHAAREETVKVVLDMDALLARAGLLVRTADGGVDRARSRVMSVGSAPSRQEKDLRLHPDAPAGLAMELRTELARWTYDGGEPVFGPPTALADPTPGADWTVPVLAAGATRRLRRDGEAVDGLVADLWRISGTHGLKTHGIVIAAGPDVDPAADLRGLSIHDVAPTVLYALGLPVADDFAGRPRVGLFRPELRRRHPVRRIATWGLRSADGEDAVTSAADAELVEELRALGYL